MRDMLREGLMENKTVEFSIEQRTAPIMVGGVGLENMDLDLQGMFEKFMPKNNKRRSMTVAQARRVLTEQEADKLVDDDKISTRAIEASENLGIIFVDEIDKVIASEGKSADVSRQGVQRDLLPIVEGTTIQTKHGYIKTDHILFIAAGAFHHGKPSELMPELQGRFPIRVELNALTKQDFVRILTEPKNSLTRQYQALLRPKASIWNSTKTRSSESLSMLSRSINRRRISAHGASTRSLKNCSNRSTSTRPRQHPIAWSSMQSM